MVFASVGPSGVMLMMGQVSEDDLKAAFAEQVAGHRRRPAPTAS